MKVVEDSQLSATLYVMVLERAGHRVEAVMAKFDRLLAKEPWRGIDVAIVDHRLSEKITGADILEYLSVHLPHIRRVAISGSDQKELSGLTADVVLQKPVTGEQIVEAVEGP